MKNTIIIAATHGGNYSGDIAVDDFKLVNGLCGGKAPTTTPTATTSLSPKVDRFNCTFESGICSFTQVSIHTHRTSITHHCVYSTYYIKKLHFVCKNFFLLFYMVFTDSHRLVVRRPTAHMFRLGRNLIYLVN